MKKKKEASDKQTEVEHNRKQIVIENTEAEESLAAALPELEKAREALADLDRSDIVEIRSFATPPEAVQVVCECVAIIKGAKEISWKTAKVMMGEGNFLKSLQEMNCDAITQKQITSVRAHMKKTTKLDDMKNVSKAGFGLLKFVQAVLGYCDVFKDVKPKQERVTFLQNDLQEKYQFLESMKNLIDDMEIKLNDYNREYEESMTERQIYKDQLDMAERRLNAADKLITGLFSEKARWTEDLKRLRADKYNIIGNCLLSASFLAYTAAFSFEFRKTMIYDDWLVDIITKGIPLSDPYKIADSLTDDVEISAWNTEGLPPDELSIQNGKENSFMFYKTIDLFIINRNPNGQIIALFTVHRSTTTSIGLD